jgi:hypothetical protein
VKRRGETTYEADISHADEERSRSNANKSKFPSISKSNDGTADKSGNSLNNCSECDTSEAVHLHQKVS